MGRKTVMILGAGVGQVGLIRKAGEMGYRTAVVSIDGPYPGFDLADVPIRIDIRDRESVLAAAKELKVEAVLTSQTDLAVPTVAFVAEELGLPGIGLECAERFTDKYLIRRLTEGLGVTPIEWERVGGLQEALQASRRMKYPLIVKPVDSQGSRGVFRVDDESSLRERFPDSQREAFNGYVLVEEYFEGVELRIDGVSNRGRFLSMPLGDVVDFDLEGLFIPQSVFYPSLLPAALQERIRQLNATVVEALRLPFGLSHAEFRLSPTTGEILLIEIAARGGGQFIASDLTPLACGVDVESVLLRQSLGAPPESVEIPYEKASCYYTGGPFPPGVLREIRGLEKAEQLSSVHRIICNLKIGGVIRALATKVDRALTFIIRGENREELARTIEELKKMVTLVIETEAGVVSAPI